MTAAADGARGVAVVASSFFIVKKIKLSLQTTAKK